MLHLEFKWYFTLTKKQSCWDKGSWCESCHSGSDVANVYGRSSRHGQMAAVQKTQQESPAQHSAPFRQSPSCSSSAEVETEWETVGPAESSCHFVIMIDSDIISQPCCLLPQHHPPPILATSEMNVHPPISRAYTASSALPGRAGGSNSLVKQNAKMKRGMKGTPKEH